MFCLLMLLASRFPFAQVQQCVQHSVSARQRFFKRGVLGLTQYAPHLDILSFYQKLAQVFFLQSVAQVLHQLGDKEMQNTAGNCVTHVHLENIKAANNVKLNPLQLFFFLKRREINLSIQERYKNSFKRTL